MPRVTLLAGLGLLALPLAALAAPQAAVPAPDPIRPWITVNAAGLPQTFTPTVLSSTTLNPPPPSLLAVATHTLRPGFPSPTSVYTGFPPVATASSPGGGVEGAFLACTDYQSATAPFCAPMKGTVLYQGWTYYVTWSAGNLPGTGATTRMVEVSITWAGTAGEDGMRAAERVPVGQGFYPWTVPGDFLAKWGKGAREMNVTFWLREDAVDTVDENDVTSWAGPSAVIVEGRPPAVPSTGEGKKGVNVAAVVVPVVVGVLVAMAVGACCWSWKKKGTVPVVGGLMKRRSGGGGAGYGVRQSRSERVGGGVRGAGDDKAAGGIQLTDRESWSPTAGKNVFREELQRQQRER